MINAEDLRIGDIVSPHGIALCIAGGGKGHDVDKPKILIEYD